MIAYFKRQRIAKDLSARIVPCFADVQDEIGNVPPSTHSDTQILASLYAAIHAGLDAHSLASEQNNKFVSGAIFEEIFRREATVILNQCDQQLADQGSEFYKVFSQRLTQDQGQLLSELKSHIDAKHEKQEYRD